MLERIVAFLRSKSLSFAFVLAGVAVGFAFALITYFLFSVKKRKVKPQQPPLRTDALVDKTVSECRDLARELTYEEKIKLFIRELCAAIIDLSHNYYKEKDKRYALPFKSEYLPEDTRIPLDFTVYELLGFAELLINDLEDLYDEIISDGRFKLAYGGFRILTRKVEEKNFKNLKISTVTSVVRYYVDKASEVREKNSVAKKIGAAALGLGVKVLRVEDFVEQILSEFCAKIIEDFNLLFSHNLRGGLTGMKYIVGDDGREAV